MTACPGVCWDRAWVSKPGSVVPVWRMSELRFRKLVGPGSSGRQDPEELGLCLQLASGAAVLALAKRPGVLSSWQLLKEAPGPADPTGKRPGSATTTQCHQVTSRDTRCPPTHPSHIRPLAASG